MLSGYDLNVTAFDDGEGFFCRACTAKAIGDYAMQRLAAGLSDHIGRWTRAVRYAVDECAVENGYEYHERGRMGHPDPLYNEAGEQLASCEECGQVACFECGVRLDTTPEQESALNVA